MGKARSRKKVDPLKSIRSKKNTETETEPPEEQVEDDEEVSCGSSDAELQEHEGETSLPIVQKITSQVSHFVSNYPLSFILTFAGICMFVRFPSWQVLQPKIETVA